MNASAAAVHQPRLTEIGQLNGPVRRPGYRPGDCGTGIVHLGIGAFHRAHQAVVTDDALAQHGGDWRIVGVSLRSTAIAQALNPQNGLYTLIEKGTSGTSARLVGSIARVVAADPAAALTELCDPAVRIVTLTVTEKGYGIDRRSRAPDLSQPLVRDDLARPDAPRGVLGLLFAAIKHRRVAGYAPFAVLSCDNLPENGASLRDGVIGFAAMFGDDALADWIAENVAFPSSMVDRITPAVTCETLAEARRQTGCDDHGAIETEPFLQWVIEDNFPSGRPKWETGGALFVDDVAPYEQMKLTMLNGSHSMMAYAGFLTGKRYVRDVMGDADLAALVTRHLSVAAARLQPLKGIDFSGYAAALEKRFRNPEIAHETRQIAMDGTQKLPQRLFQPAVGALNAGQDPRAFAFATAMWMRFCLGKTDDGASHDLNDPRETELTDAVAGKSQDAAAISDALHELPDLIPPRLGADTAWRSTVEEILATALRQGCRNAIHKEATAP